MTSVTVDIHKWGIVTVDTPVTFEQMNAIHSNQRILTEAWHVLHETVPQPRDPGKPEWPGRRTLKPSPMQGETKPRPPRTLGIGLPETKGGPRRWWQWWRR
jgi:hypothetical protein